MFTGIVQGMGRIVAVNQPSPDFRTHIVELPLNMADNLQTGASVANNGCCLTITEIEANQVSFDLMNETLAKTNLGRLKAGDWVNLERAAKFGDEIGGHVMSGHIMATTTITRIDENEFNRTLWFRLPADLKPYILTKGFVGLDGCSLTIGDVTDDEFNVHLIPETLECTLFGTRQVGDEINIEIDPQTQAIVDTVLRVMAQHQ
ncbi:riboflavin synthase subunit alpha [Neisseria sp. N95_16]|uniref:Riboflavin synthase n=1 Tax=Neisseria brasiliensis TaxID=2666100 RepID=A0A5Q3S241_9NEIS|nr:MULTISPECIES: riboflavin synthase subunit alpha [Neisseria]MRN39262.1 riboflavin synthase subunit alpha [Neisseria brasiliensis]PJO09854.1 riboflavin synthase subunit alpha [Neisseria sp. N95_16]PJO77702.1 riboflavin synthase subunit alpha [Neisseria sp. N177_16]QGL26260.1 riboflavin synthase subunit alpha [Neisseria brasiliensis]